MRIFNLTLNRHLHEKLKLENMCSDFLSSKFHENNIFLFSIRESFSPLIQFKVLGTHMPNFISTYMLYIPPVAQIYNCYLWRPKEPVCWWWVPIEANGFKIFSRNLVVQTYHSSRSLWRNQKYIRAHLKSLLDLLVYFHDQRKIPFPTQNPLTLMFQIQVVFLKIDINSVFVLKNILPIYHQQEQFVRKVYELAFQKQQLN